jgi:hypothetical protein
MNPSAAFTVLVDDVAVLNGYSTASATWTPVSVNFVGSGSTGTASLEIQSSCPGQASSCGLNFDTFTLAPTDGSCAIGN